MALSSSKVGRRIEGKTGMSFTPKGSQYRVGTSDLVGVREFPYVFRWEKPRGKNVAVSTVIATLIDPCEGDMEVDFTVSCRRESFNRMFCSLNDILKSCDKVENQLVSTDLSNVVHVVKAYFDCVPPIILERTSDSISISLRRRMSIASESYVMCEGWLYDCSETTVRDIMHSALYIREDLSVHEAARLMSEREVGSVLSIGKTGEVVGVLTERDMLKKVLGQGLDPRSTLVKEVASSPVVNIESRTSIDEAAELMAEKHIRRLPVVEDGTIVGIVTDRDLIRAIPGIFKRGVP